MANDLIRGMIGGLISSAIVICAGVAVMVWQAEHQSAATL
jgi:hypothetical protein